MFNDKAIVWVLEYIFGGTLVILPLVGLSVYRHSWMDTYLWATGLFVVCLGVTLISCASSMRQRMLLARRIEILDEQIQSLAIS